MTVNNQKPIEFNNVANCIVDYRELEKAILWIQDKPTLSKKKIYMHGYYPCVSIHDKKYHVHRLLMMYWLGRKLETNEHVHHINENKLDSSKGNLEVLDSFTHLSNHLTGREFTEKHKEGISKANKNRKGIKYKRNNFVDREKLYLYVALGYNISDISKMMNFSRDIIRLRIKEDVELSKLYNNEHKKTTKEKGKHSNFEIVGINVGTRDKVYFKSTMEADRNGFKSGAISDCINGKTKKHRGYFWFYEKDYHRIFKHPNLLEE